MKYQYKMFTDTKCLPIQSGYQYKMFTNTKCLPIQNVYQYKVLTNTKCLPIQSVYQYSSFCEGQQMFLILSSWCCCRGYGAPPMRRAGSWALWSACCGTGRASACSPWAGRPAGEPWRGGCSPGPKPVRTEQQDQSKPEPGQSEPEPEPVRTEPEPDQSEPEPEPVWTGQLSQTQKQGSVVWGTDTRFKQHTLWSYSGYCSCCIWLADVRIPPESVLLP